MSSSLEYGVLLVATIIGFALWVRSRPYAGLPLGRLASEDYGKRDAAVRDVVRRKPRNYALKAARLLLEHRTTHLTLSAKEIVELARDRRVVDPLLAELSRGASKGSGGGVPRSWIVDVLGCVGDERVVPPLLDALRRGEAAERAAAAKGLGRLRAAKAIEPLVAALSDREWEVRSKAADALGSFSDERVVVALSAYLRKGADKWTPASSEECVRDSVLASIKKLNPDHPAVLSNDRLRDAEAQRNRHSSCQHTWNTEPNSGGYFHHVCTKCGMDGGLAG